MPRRRPFSGASDRRVTSTNVTYAASYNTIGNPNTTSWRVVAFFASRRIRFRPTRKYFSFEECPNVQE
jgi:hypothetical protein